MKLCFLVLLATGLSISSVWADQAGAEREVERFEKAVAVYANAIKEARTPEAQAEAAALRPRASAYALRLIGELRGNWREKWVVPHMAWVLNYAPDIPREQIAGLKKVFRQVHVRSEGAGQFAYALRNVPDPDSLVLAEEVLEKNPSKVEQGLAALGIAQMLENLGDDPEIISRRLKMLRLAIVESADEVVAGQKVSDVAAESLFVLNNLTKGREAPVLEGSDLAGKALKLSDFRGKVVALVFWSTQEGAQGEDTLRWLKETAADIKSEDFVMLGVSVDSRAAVQRLTADGEITWANILDDSQSLAQSYRVRSLPQAYVIDREGKIQYKGLPGAFVTFAAEALLLPAGEASE